MTRPQDLDPDSAVRFLQTAYGADDWLAVFVKAHKTARVLQRVAPVSVIVGYRFQDWLVRENQAGASIYVSVNALRPRATVRRRAVVSAVRHVFLDADEGLDDVLDVVAA